MDLTKECSSLTTCAQTTCCTLNQKPGDLSFLRPATVAVMQVVASMITSVGVIDGLGIAGMFDVDGAELEDASMGMAEEE